KDDKKDDKKDEKATLKWDFVKNKKFYQTLKTETKQTMTVMNNEVKQTQTQTFYFEWTVTEEPKDNVVTIKQTIIGVVMDIDIGNQKITYNSTDAKDATNPLADFFKQLVNSDFTLKFNLKENKVTEIKGRDEFLSKLSKANPQMKPLLEAILTDEALKQM